MMSKSKYQEKDFNKTSDLIKLKKEEIKKAKQELGQLEEKYEEALINYHVQNNTLDYLDKRTLLAIRDRVYCLINAIESQQYRDSRARGLYLLVCDLQDAIDNNLTHADLMDFGFYPKRFPEYWLL